MAFSSSRNCVLFTKTQSIFPTVLIYASAVPDFEFITILGFSVQKPLRRALICINLKQLIESVDPY